MNRIQFMSLLSKPEIPDSKISGQLHDVLMSYPYCQSARLLYVKSLTDQHSILFNDQLKIASAYATDRSRLYELMNQNLQEEKAEVINEIISDDKIINEELIEPIVFEKEIESVSKPDILSSAVRNENINEAQPDDSAVFENNDVSNEEDSDQLNEVEEPAENVKSKPTEISKLKIESNEKINLPVIPKQAELSPQEIIKQRLEELNKVEMEEVSDSAVTFQTEDLKSSEAVANVDSDENIPIKNEVHDNIQEEIKKQLPEIIESTLVEEEHLDIVEGEDTIGIENEDVESAKEDKSVDSSFTQDVKIKVESITEKTEVPNEISVSSSEIIDEEKIEEIEITIEDEGEHSFLSWLKAVDTDSIVELSKVDSVVANKNTASDKELEQENLSEKLISDKDLKSSSDLINRFIEDDPKIEPGKAQFYSAGNMAKNSIVDDGSLASETLANIYLEQGNHQKAINMLELLSLKNPKKSAYFAGRIKEIKNSNR